MADKQIETYLNHHLGGAVTALEVLEHLETMQKGTPMERVLVQLRADLAADRRVLEELMGRLKVAQSGTQKATAWLGEKVSRLKLQLDDRKGRALHLLEALEALSLAIEGKRALWFALSVAVQDTPELRLLDYELLIDRAQEQRRRVEEMRLDAARIALHPAQ